MHNSINLKSNQNILINSSILFMVMMQVIYCLPNSKDSIAYHMLLDELPNTFDRFNYPSLEYLFWGWLHINKVMGFNLAFALTPLSFLALHMKFKVFNAFGKSSLYVPLAYVSIFYLLHEGSQLRIAIGLAFALCACLAIAQRNRLKAIVLIATSVGFHLSAALLPFVFYCCFFSLFIQRLSWFFLGASVFAYIKSFDAIEAITTLFSYILPSLDARYLLYTDDSFRINQNSSGLFIAYGFILSFLLIFLHYWFKKHIGLQTRLLKVCLAVCVFGDGLLFFLRDFVVVASRLSDVLTILIIPLIATVIRASCIQVRLLSIAALASFFLIRGYQLFDWF